MVSAFFPTPFGDGVITVREGRLVGVDLPRTTGGMAVRPGAVAVEAQNPVAAEDRLALDRWVRELSQYFSGHKLSWLPEEIALDTLPVGGFARAVYETLLTVPPGQTVSYGGLAEMAGFPRAARAVGTAMATNPVPIVIPCHRVVRSDGNLGNYGDDPAWKAHLLAHERDHSSEPEGAA
jgi:methylated-DNA-[protein]-cysteine S-methyltransferase